MNPESGHPHKAKKIHIGSSTRPPFPGIGFTIGGYTITNTLGYGSMAMVFLAEDSTGSQVALKVIQEGTHVSPTMLERFRREVQASKKLRRHPHIMTIYATGKDGPYQYIAMEWIPKSKTLESALESTPMNLKTTVTIITKIARALQYAHLHKIIHRDVKPSNIMIDEFGEPVLSDFGVAELVDWPSFTVSGALTGTPLYMSPEQARGERVGPASDIYSLGVVLYEALTGILPYKTQHYSPVKKVLDTIQYETPRRPRLFRKEISPDLEAVTLKALEQNPADRYPDAEAFALDLERAIAGRNVKAHRFSSIDTFRFLCRKYQHVVAMAILVVLIVSCVSMYYRSKLYHAHYTTLMEKARLLSINLKTAHTEDDLSMPYKRMPAAWNLIRLARRSMQSGNCIMAISAFEGAIRTSREQNDYRTMSIAMLEQARCEMILELWPNAIRIYDTIINTDDTPPVVKQFAELEKTMATILQHEGYSFHDNPEAISENVQPNALSTPSLSMRTTLHNQALEPLITATACLQQQMDSKQLEHILYTAPPMLRNDLLLALALCRYCEGNISATRTLLKQCVQQSSPANDWPAPFAKEIYSGLQHYE